MRKHQIFQVLLTALLVTLPGWLIWRANHPAGEAPVVVKAVAPVRFLQADVAPARAATASTQATRYFPSAATINALQDDPELTIAQKAVLRMEPSKGARYAMFAQIRSETNSKRIDFYGKVVDQDGQPISGVQVKGSILLVVSPIASANKEVLTESDLAGRFQFVGLRGSDFGLLLQKDGYESNGRSLNWSASYKPDTNNPVVFILWRLQGADPMLHTDVDSRVPYDGRMAAFDLLSGRRVESGDLKITLLRSPLQVRRGVDRFDWKVLIEVAGGGMLEATDAYPYLAPEAGYQPSISFAQAKDGPKWTQKLTKTYYVHRASGEYGRVRIDLTTDSENTDTGVTIETWLNPSGSRNLEFDPTKTVKVVAPKRSL